MAARDGGLYLLFWREVSLLSSIISTGFSDRGGETASGGYCALAFRQEVTLHYH